MHATLSQSPAEYDRRGAAAFQFLHAGEAAWLALADAHGYLAKLAEKSPDAAGLGDEDLFIPLAECRLYAPLRPSKLICVAGNYGGTSATR